VNNALSRLYWYHIINFIELSFLGLSNQVRWHRGPDLLKNHLVYFVTDLIIRHFLTGKHLGIPSLFFFLNFPRFEYFLSIEVNINLVFILVPVLGISIV
jgi:hypothetical protein